MTGATASPTFLPMQAGIAGAKSQGSKGMSAARRVGDADALDVLQVSRQGLVAEVPGAVLSLQRDGTGHVRLAERCALLRGAQRGDVRHDRLSAVESLDVVLAVAEVDVRCALGHGRGAREKPLDRGGRVDAEHRSEERRVGKECRSRWS